MVLFLGGNLVNYPLELSGTLMHTVHIQHDTLAGDHQQSWWLGSFRLISVTGLDSLMVSSKIVHAGAVLTSLESKVKQLHNCMNEIRIWSSMNIIPVANTRSVDQSGQLLFI